MLSWASAADGTHEVGVADERSAGCVLKGQRQEKGLEKLKQQLQATRLGRGWVGLLL